MLMSVAFSIKLIADELSCPPPLLIFVLSQIRRLPFPNWTDVKDKLQTFQKRS